MPRKRSITQTRQSFEAIEAERARKAQERTNEMVHKLIGRMANGDPCDTDDFIFAATIGETKAHRQQSDMLRIAARLTLNDTVGVASDGKIHAVGLADESPLQMTVVEGKQWWDFQAPMTASLRLRLAAKRIVEPIRNDAIHIPQDNQGRATTTLLYRESSHHLRATGNAFSEQHELLVGSATLTRYAASSHDQLNHQLLAAHFERVASVWVQTEIEQVEQ